MALAAQMICNVRSADRLSVDLDATMRDSTARPIEVEIDTISASGFSMVTRSELSIGDLITVGISGLGMHAAIVVRNDGANYGCRFVIDLPRGAVDALLEPQATVTPFPRSPQHVAPAALDAVDTRYPVRTRAAIIVGLSLACWGAIDRIGGSLIDGGSVETSRNVASALAIARILR